jgi:predicted dehydrogenase
MKIIIIGNGVYVSGRGTNGFGTVLPAIVEYQRLHQSVEHVVMTGTNPMHAEEAEEKIRELMQLTDVSFQLESLPKTSVSNVDIYKDIISKIDQPACTIVAVPDHLHYKIARDCLEAGLHTLVVKPLTPTVSEAKDLISLSNQKNLYGAVEFHKRYDRHNLKLKEAISDGEIGDPLYFLVEYSQRKNIPLKTFSAWVDKTNVFQYLGVHYVDIIYFITGATPKRVQVLGQKSWLKEQGVDTFDAIHATIEWEMQNGKNFLSFIHTNWIDPENTSAMSDQRMKVIGTKGRIESNQKNRGLQKITDTHGIEDINPDFCNTYPLPNGKLSYQGYGIDSINTFLNDIQNIMHGNIKPGDLEGKRPTFTDSLVSTAVVEAVNNGLKKQGVWLEIDV